MIAKPTGDRSREEILNRRAAQLAAVDTEKAHHSVAMQIAVVSVGGQRVGIPAEDLREIVPLRDVTSLPGLPSWMLGLVQVRGELLGVVDLALLVGASGERPGWLAIAEGSGGPLGIAVHAVLGFRDVFVDEISAELGEGVQRPFRAVTKDLVAVLDVRLLPVVSEENT